MKGKFSIFVVLAKQVVVSISAILITIFCLSHNLSAQSKINESLFGLDSISVNWQVNQSYKHRDALEAFLMVTAVRYFKNTGLVTNKESKNKLNIFVNTIEIQDNYFSYSIDISLNQLVILERRKANSFYAPTWQMTTMGTTSDGSAIEKAISELLSKFVADYQAAKQFFNDALDKFLWGEQPKKSDSPFTATYVGGNRPPEVEIFNDTDRTLYLDFGQDTLTPYTIPPKSSKKFTLTEGIYKFKATVPRVVPIAGQETFQKGYAYSWRFVIITRRIN